MAGPPCAKSSVVVSNCDRQFWPAQLTVPSRLTEVPESPLHELQRLCPRPPSEGMEPRRPHRPSQPKPRRALNWRGQAQAGCEPLRDNGGSRDPPALSPSADLPKARERPRARDPPPRTPPTRVVLRR